MKCPCAKQIYWRGRWNINCLTYCPFVPGNGERSRFSRPLLALRLQLSASTYSNPLFQGKSTCQPKRFFNSLAYLHRALEVLSPRIRFTILQAAFPSRFLNILLRHSDSAQGKSTCQPKPLLQAVVVVWDAFFLHHVKPCIYFKIIIFPLTSSAQPPSTNFILFLYTTLYHEDFWICRSCAPIELSFVCKCSSRWCQGRCPCIWQ